MFGFNRSPAKRNSTRRTRKNELRVESLETRVLFAGDGIQGGAPLIDGTGIKIGVISVGIEHYAAIAAASPDILPTNLTIHPTLSGNPANDEGTAMLEVVHSVAPGAQLFFAGHPGASRMTAAQMREAIQWMMSNDVDVIVDALDFYDQPYFTDGTGTVAEQVKLAIEEGVTYVSAAGEAVERHYQGMFASTGGDFPLRHDFESGAGVDSFLRVRVPPGAIFDVTLQWSDEWGASANDYNLTIWNDPPTQVLASSVITQNGTQNPFERIADLFNPTDQNIFINISVVRTSNAAPRELELFLSEAGSIEIFDPHNTPGDAIFGHKAVEGVITVGAVDSAAPQNVVWEESSGGPSTVVTNFATQAKQLRNSLDGVAIHNVETQVGELGHFDDPFESTSASAARVAGIVALMQHAHDNLTLRVGDRLTPAQVATILKNTAVDIGPAGYDQFTGAGRFDATAALTAIQNQPKVNQVTVRNTADVHGGYLVVDRNGTAVNWGQIATAPVGGGMNRISINFTEPVIVHQNDLVVRGNGGLGAVIPSTNFSYNASNNTATWTFNTILRDHLWLTLDGTSANAVTDADGNRLDGEWISPLGYSDNEPDSSNYPSGNGVAGGNFEFAVTILTGDANRDGRVTLADLAAIQRNLGKMSGAIWEDGDISGDGKVTALDAALFSASFGVDFRDWPSAASSSSPAANAVVAATSPRNHGEVAQTPRIAAHAIAERRSRLVPVATDIVLAATGHESPTSEPSARPRRRVRLAVPELANTRLATN